MTCQTIFNYRLHRERANLSADNKMGQNRIIIVIDQNQIFEGLLNISFFFLNVQIENMKCEAV